MKISQKGFLKSKDEKKQNKKKQRNETMSLTMTVFESVKVIFCILFNSGSQNFKLKLQIITVFHVFMSLQLF